MGELKGIDGLKNQVQECIQYAYDKGVKAGQKEAIEEIKQKWIEQGRDEAWEAARKIVLEIVNGGLYRYQLYRATEIFTNYSASEVIEKIKAWEEKKAEDDEINVGDEVKDSADGTKAVVLDFIDNSKYVTVFNENSIVEDWEIRKIHKTGRTFPQIAEVLEKMREGK